MRFPHWLKTVASALVLTATAGPVLAQGPGSPGGGQPMFQPAYGTNDPRVLYPQGTPSGYQPYPAISPYGMGNVAWDQTFRDDDGLWFRRLMNSNREYYGSIEATFNKMSDPGNRHLGSAYIPYDDITGGPQGFIIPTYNQGGNPGTTAGGAQGAASTLPDTRAIIDTRVWPYPWLSPASTPPVTYIVNDLFPIRGLSAFSEYRSAGLQGRWGFFNEDGTGLGVSGFWAAPNKQDFTMGQDTIGGVEITQAIIFSLDGSILFSRNGAIPLDWGLQEVGVGAHNLGTAKYDLLFHYDVKSSAIGADSNFYMTPIVHRDAFKLRPFIGARYLHIDEGFYFRGIDSGFGYELTDSLTTGGGGGGGGGGGAQASRTYRPDANTLQSNYDLYEATLSNKVRSNLAGPQIGLRYDLGDGDEFNVWGQSIVGVLANREDYTQYGNNIGDPSSLQLNSTLDMLATDARFSSRRTVNHLSPMFEQQFNAEMQILDMIPGVRKIPGIEDTVFRVGYSFTVVGEVAKAGESIDWRGFPQFPSIRPGRDAWWLSKWSFGVERRF